MDEAFLNDLLECSVCLEQLDGSSKVLPCQHTFCKRCLDEIVNSHKELRCPECRVLVEVKVDELPSNILLIRLLEGIKNNPRLKQTNTKEDSKSTVQHFVPQRVFSHVHSAIRQATPHHTPVSLESKAVLKQPSHTTPCAKAIYTYEGKEPGDLSFKKSDIIYLQRRIDQNWYHGEVNGKYGFVPARYIRVIVPLPTHIPQCKALYDFSVSTNDEKDCLRFSKGEVITVIRRVDDNWAEGKLGDQIGIFPISFVEMNVAARSLMKLSINTQPGPSRVAPPTPTLDTSLGSNSAASKLNTAKSDLAPSNVDSLSSTTTTPSSSTTPSPSTPPSSSNSSSSLPQTTPVPPLKDALLEKPSVLTRSASQRHNSHSREKRHSLSSICAASQKSPHVPVTHKHSSEILSTAGGDVLAAPTRTITERNSSEPLPIPSVVKEGKEDSRSCINRKHSEAPKPPSARTAINHSQPINTSNASPVTYIALFNYHPQKEDELELKKGEFYSVSEKCQDGWFKGTSHRTGRSGVFPGNYVHYAKSTQNQIQILQASSALANIRTSALNLKSLLPISNASPRQKPPAPVLATSDNIREKKDSSQSKNVDPLLNRDPLLYLACSSSSTEANAQENIPVSPSKSSEILPWLNKLAISSSSFLAPTAMAASYPSAASQDVPTSLSSDSISQSWHAGAKPHAPRPSPPSMSIVSPPNVSLKAVTSTTHSSSYAKSEKHKIRKDKTRESLMKRFTSKKRTRVPVANFSCDNPSFVDSSHSTSVELGHARSGSCPSEVLNRQEPSNPIKGIVSSAPKSGSHLKQPLLVRERFRCVVPYPPNSEYELELKVGDIVYVHKKREDGWYKGTLLRTGKTGLFPASFVDLF